MALEDLTGASKFIDDLVVTNPVGSTDTKSTLDDHIRGVKNVLKNSFPNITGAMTATDTELSQLAGFTIASGTWTPTLQDTSLSDAEGQTYSTNSGHYNRIGSVVFIVGRITMSSIGTLTAGDNAYIAGLPIAAASSAYGNTGGINVTQGASLSITAGNNLTGTVEAGQTYLSLHKWTAATGSGAMTISNVTASGDLQFYGSYRV